MTKAVMLTTFLLGLVGLGLGAFFAVADWRARGLRYLTTVLIAGLAIAFSGWNLWGFKPTRKPKDFETVRNRVVKDFESSKATRVTLTRLGKTTIFEKKDGKWMMVKPLPFPADHDGVENLLTEIQMLDRDKTLPGPRTKAEYGFGDNPIAITVEGSTPSPLTLTLGGQDVTGGKVYLARNGQERVLVVNRHFREAMDKDPRDLRDTKALGFKVGEVTGVTLTNEGGKPVHLTLKDKAWSLRAGNETHPQRANAKSAEELLRKLEDLRATTFLEAGPEALKNHGLETPAQSVVVEATETHTLLLGGPCPNRREDRLAGRRGAFPAAFCLRVKELQEILGRTDDLRDARVLGSEEASITAIRITAGERTLHLKKEGLMWQVVKPKDSPLKQASYDQVEAFLRDLRSQTVITFLPPPADDSAKAQYGLSAPRAVLTLELESGATETLTLGSEDADKNYYAKRSGEDLVVVLHRRTGLALSPSVLPFRDRTLLTFSKEPTEAVEITASTGAVSEQASYEGGLWRLKKPVALRADVDAMDALLSVFSQLTVERFVSESPQGEHGLATPSRTLAVTLEREDLADPAKPEKKVEKHTLRLGAKDPGGGCFGQLDGSPVFLLKAEQCRDLMAHLATRRIADISASQVTEIRLVRGGATEHLERRGLQWGRKNGPRVAADVVEGLLTNLAAMRARRVVSYGAPGPTHGLAQPSMLVELHTTGHDAKPLVLRVGAPLTEGTTVVGHYAQVEGRAVVYLLGLPEEEALRKVKL